MDIDYIIKEIKDGKNEKKVILIDMVRPLIISMANKYSDNNSFEDLFQDSVEILLDSINKYDPSLKVPFIGFFQKRLLYFHLNNCNKSIEALSLDTKIKNTRESFKDIIPSQDKDNLDRLIWTEDRNMLVKAVGNLTDKQRWIIIEYYFKGKKLIDISKQYKIHYQSLVKLKARALRNLKKFIDNEKYNIM
ncbi:MAG: sigma-70 family RNA polymerase sigma factor [Eubacteriaceae bacterium]